MSALKKLYGAIAKVEDQEDGTIKVWGIASSAVADSDGETITADAMKAALPDYMKFGAVREMHQPKAAGTALEAEVQEDGTTKFCAHVVDSEAVKKVKTGVYKGFSIGGKVTSRDDLKKTTITGLRLVEVSLVDRPANPDAVITMYKSELLEPKQIWACAHIEHQHLAKADAVKCLETDAGEADTLEKIDNEPGDSPSAGLDAAAPTEATGSADDDQRADADGAEAGAEKADEATDLKKGMYSVSNFASLLQSILCMAQDAEYEAEWEKDSSPIPAQLREWLKAGTVIFAAMATEEVAELIATLSPQEPVDIAMADKAGDLQKAGARNSKADLEKIQTMHDHAVDLGAQCSAAEKAEPVTDLHKMAAPDLEKYADVWFAKYCSERGIEEAPAISAYIKDANDELVKRRERIEELEKQPAAPKGALRAIGKADDIGGPGGEAQIDPIKKSDGTVDEEATAIKMARAKPITL